VEFAGDGDEFGAVGGIEVGGVHHAQAAEREALAKDEIQQLEGLRGDGLIALVVGYHGTAGVGRDDFGRQEMALRKRGFPRTGRPDEQHKGEFREVEGHALIITSAAVPPWTRAGSMRRSRVMNFALWRTARARR